MCAADDAIDIIHEAEEKATKRIQEAEIIVKQMKEETDVDVKRILQESQSQAQQTATLAASDVAAQKEEIERRSQKELEAIITKMEDSARGHRTSAIVAVAKILLGEEQ